MGGFEIALPIIITVVVIAATVVPMIFIFGRFFKRQAAAAKLMQTGEAAQGQILAVQETGTRINDQPEVAITLLVTRQGQAPYQAQATSVVSAMMIPRLQPGMTVPVKVDPQNPASVAVDKGALSSMPMAMPGMMMPGMQAGMMPGMQAGMMPGAQPQMMMPGMQPGMMSQQQAMAMAQQAMAQPPAGGSIITCPQCGNPYASANPMCPNCGAAKPQGY